MTTLSENIYRTGGYIVSEASGYRSREQGIIKAGSGVLLAGAPLSLLTPDTGAVTVGAAVFTGTGNGVFTPANPAYGAGVKEGDYVVRLIEAGANAGQFEVKRPDGTIDGFASVGVAYDGQIKGTFGDGTTDFAGAAQFVIPVSIANPTGVGKYVPYDGSRPAVAILYEGCNATDVDVRRTFTARDTEVTTAELQWASGVTSDQKTAALASLASLGIIGR
ncbi:head decoration protein [Rhodopseudomonas sp. BR0C11]|uniref:head decoration protein n=1 Tax=Rhodopseudomonas sp. BR0C11 TaxID=2269370 RepID=UPI0013E05A71|nr:head decoration protein [Rhodopseudomonas sp. BR0C11]NEV79421.1 head decoration protein [Rhodopseudomonas sp. BR0C11]